MKLPSALYVVLAILGMFAVVGAMLTVYSSGSAALPLWASAVRPGPLSQAHAFLGDRCESCHAPNRGIVATKCVTCHAWAPELLMKPVTAFHANIGECRGCHLEHKGASVRPIQMDHAALERVAKRAGGPPVALQCQSCHAFQDKHQGFFGKQCATCHATKTWDVPNFVHPSPRSTDCGQCHKPPPSHLMMHFEMMDKSITGQKTARVEQCNLCHQTDSFNNIRGVGWYDMH